MSTGTKIIQSALSKIGAHSAAKPANPESIENVLNKLNSYISRLRDDKIDFGASALAASSSELSEPMGLTSVIEDNLAILLQPDHPGTQISQQLKINANIGHNYMVRKYRTISIPKPIRRDTMPLGHGNGYINNFDRIFTSDEVVPDIPITNKMLTGEINDYQEDFRSELGTEAVSSFTLTVTDGLSSSSSSESNGVISYRISVLDEADKNQEVSINVTTSAGRILSRTIDFEVVDD